MTITDIEKTFFNACKHYNECVAKNDDSSIDALNDLITATEDYKAKTGYNVKFVGDKDTQDTTGQHTIKRVDVIGRISYFQF